MSNGIALMGAVAAIAAAGIANAGVVNVSGDITASTTWTADNTYNLLNQVYGALKVVACWPVTADIAEAMPPAREWPAYSTVAPCRFNSRASPMALS